MTGAMEGERFQYLGLSRPDKSTQLEDPLAEHSQQKRYVSPDLLARATHPTQRTESNPGR